MHRLPRHVAVLLVVSAMLTACGCTLGPRQINHSRLKYNDAVQQTFQEEMLLNLVRLKYRELPEFLTVGAIAAQYTFEGSTGAGLTIPEGGANILGLNGAVARSERPTISYAPARGEQFQKGLLAPVDLESLQLLARTGWSWERILRITVQYMNDVDNATSAGGPTPERKPQFEEFRYLTQLLRHLQTERDVELAKAKREGDPIMVPLPRDQLNGDFVLGALEAGYEFRETPQGLSLFKEEQYLAMVFRPAARYTREMQEVARLLGLVVHYESQHPEVYAVTAATEGHIQPAFQNVGQSPNTQVSWAQPNGVHMLPSPSESQTRSTGRTKIVVSTRSLLEVMFFLSQGISIPEEHVNEGLVTMTVDENGYFFDWRDMTGDLLQVCSSKKRPHYAAVAVPFKGYWFYIDDRDLNSQSTFTLLVELFGIEVQAGGGGGFLYTLSVGG